MTQVVFTNLFFQKYALTIISWVIFQFFKIDIPQELYGRTNRTIMYGATEKKLSNEKIHPFH